MSAAVKATTHFTRRAARGLRVGCCPKEENERSYPMSDILVGILGLICITAIVVTLFKSKTQPAIAFIVFPAVLGLIMVIGGRYSFDNLATMIKSGFNSTGPTAALFVFSVLYFGIMTDAGMFDVIIGKLMGLVGDNVIGVALVTAVIALVGHLDGGGASTFCIVIPAMLPVYKRMHMRTTTLLRIAVLSMGVLNLMPCAGSTMRAASVLGVEAGSLWKTILPIQIFGILLALAHAALSGWQEKRRGAGLHGRLAETEGTVEVEQAQAAAANELARPKLFLFNILLTVVVIVMLVWDVFPSYFPFMLGVAIALFVNYGFTAKMHKKIINLHAGPALITNDPQYYTPDRQMMVEIDHPQHGKVKVPGFAPRMSAVTVEYETSPELGGSNKEIYGDLLGYTEEQMAEMKKNRTI